MGMFSILTVLAFAAKASCNFSANQVVAKKYIKENPHLKDN